VCCRALQGHTATHGIADESEDLALGVAVCCSVL